MLLANITPINLMKKENSMFHIKEPACIRMSNKNNNIVVAKMRVPTSIWIGRDYTGATM